MVADAEADLILARDCPWATGPGQRFFAFAAALRFEFDRLFVAPVPLEAVHARFGRRPRTLSGFLLDDFLLAANLLDVSFGRCLVRSGRLVTLAAEGANLIA